MHLWKRFLSFLKKDVFIFPTTQVHKANTTDEDESINLPMADNIPGLITKLAEQQQKIKDQSEKDRILTDGLLACFIE